MPFAPERFIVPVATVVAAVVLGWVLDAVLVARIRRAAARHGWAGGEATARALHGMPPVWTGLAAAYLVIVTSGLPPRAEALSLRWLYVGAVASATLAAARLVSGLVRLYTAREDTRLPSTSIFVNLARIVVIALGVMLALNGLGVSITPLLTALGVGGLAVALALQDTLGNLFAGLNVAASRKIQPGDFIRLVDSGVEGTVTDITWRYTSLEQPANNLVVVPNSTLATSTFVNFSRPDPELSVVVEVPLEPGTDVAAARSAALAVAAEVVGECAEAAPGAEPVVRAAAFGAAGVTLNVSVRAREYSAQWALRDELLTRLHARFAAEGIRLSAPFARP